MEKRASGAIRRRGPDEAGAFSPMDVCMHDSFNEIGFIFQHVSRYKVHAFFPRRIPPSRSFAPNSRSYSETVAKKLKGHKQAAFECGK